MCFSNLTVAFQRREAQSGKRPVLSITSDNTQEKKTDLRETTSTNICWTGWMSGGEVTQMWLLFSLLVLPVHVLASWITKHVPVTVLHHYRVNDNVPVVSISCLFTGFTSLSLPPCSLLPSVVMREEVRLMRWWRLSISSSKLSGQEPSGFGSILQGWLLTNSTVGHGNKVVRTQLYNIHLVEQKHINISVWKKLLQPHFDKVNMHKTPELDMLGCLFNRSFPRLSTRRQQSASFTHNYWTPWASQSLYLLMTGVGVWVRWAGAGGWAALPSAVKTGLTLAGLSRSSRPLVKTPGGCIRWGRGRVNAVSL